MTVTARWPDGTVHEHYSPSLVMHDHLTAGGVYTVADFSSRSATALGKASERVRAQFGFACTSAAASAERIAELASAYEPDEVVRVIAMEPPLPTTKESR